MQSPADQFLPSIQVPTSDKITMQLNDAREKLQDTGAILEVLQEALETVKQLPEGADRKMLIRELESNINRHKLLIERESVKLSVKEKYLKNILNIDTPQGDTTSSSSHWFQED